MSWYNPASWFGNDNQWSAAQTELVSSGVYHEVIFLRLTHEYPASLRNWASAGGFRLVQFRSVGKLEGFEKYSTYHGYVSSDLHARPLGDLNAAIGPGSAILRRDPVSLLEQTKLDAIWDASVAAGHISEDVIGGATEEATAAVQDVLASVSDQTGDITEKAAAGVWASVPWLGIAGAGAGLAALLYFLKRRKKR